MLCPAEPKDQQENKLYYSFINVQQIDLLTNPTKQMVRNQ